MAPRAPRPLVFTVGHSNRPLADFLQLLASHGIERVVDVRRFPHSPRQPPYDGRRLAKTLEKVGIGYEHLVGLGGRRSPDRTSTRNAGWEHRNFRGYADHLDSPEFEADFARLVASARAGRVAILCAEAVWWRCHRRLLADVLTVQGFEVRHIASERRSTVHVRTPFLRVRRGRLTYPAGARTAERPPARRSGDRPPSQPSL